MRDPRAYFNKGTYGKSGYFSQHRLHRRSWRQRRFEQVRAREFQHRYTTHTSDGGIEEFFTSVENQSRDVDDCVDERPTGV